MKELAREMFKSGKSGLGVFLAVDMICLEDTGIFRFLRKRNSTGGSFGSNKE